MKLSARILLVLAVGLAILRLEQLSLDRRLARLDLKATII